MTSSIQQNNSHVYFSGLAPVGIPLQPIHIKFKIVYRKNKRLFLRKLGNTPVDFYLDDLFLQSETTDKHGIVTLTFQQYNPGKHTLTGKTSLGTATTPIFIIPSEKKVIICDIDGTLSSMKEWKVPLWGGKAKCIANSNLVLSNLSKQFQFIYITARDTLLHKQTLQFLNSHHFPDGPIFYRNWFRLLEGKRSSIKLFKKEIIQRLLMNRVCVVAGIGNSKHDQYAYTKNGIKMYLYKKNLKRLPPSYFNDYKTLENTIWKDFLEKD